MSSPAVQLSFTLRTSPNARTVHLAGSWDGYKSQLPLSAAKDGKPGSWKGTFRFQGAHALKLGSRYWYYYIVDGYHVSHDPAKEHVVEKTTGRKLNILNVPSAQAAKPKAEPKAEAPKVAMGRALSPSRIACPKPQKPHASKNLREGEYEMTLEQLEEHFTKVAISADRYVRSPSEISDCSEASGSVFSKTSGSASSATSESDSGSCTCGRFGVTRDGRRVKLDCGGKRCGYADESSECESDSEDEVEIRRQALVAERKRNGIKTTAQVSSRGRVAAHRN